ncbi:MAG: hypothetical protein KDD11_06740 [Acidobacteria bacterium]|nr:hypothetical protein [Acidobacteriota bacterium]
MALPGPGADPVLAGSVTAGGDSDEETAELQPATAGPTTAVARITASTAPHDRPVLGRRTVGGWW